MVEFPDAAEPLSHQIASASSCGSKCAVARNAAKKEKVSLSPQCIFLSTGNQQISNILPMPIPFWTETLVLVVCVLACFTKKYNFYFCRSQRDVQYSVQVRQMLQLYVPFPIIDFGRSYSAILATCFNYGLVPLLPKTAAAGHHARGA